MEGLHIKKPLPFSGSHLRLLLFIFIVGCMLPGLAHASGWQPDSVAFYWAKWAETSLLEIPEDLIQRDLEYMKPEFLAVSAAYSLSESPVLLHFLHVESEFTVVKHITGQTHWEGSWALGVRTGPLMPPDLGLLTLQVGNGFSYALGQPTFEKNSEGLRGQGKHPFQYHLNFELAYSPPRIPRWTIATRLHHRSGIYGIISPQKTGSNYIGVLLRYRL